MSSYSQLNQQIWVWLEAAGDWARFIPYIGPALDQGTNIGKKTFTLLNKTIKKSSDAIIGASNLATSIFESTSKAWHISTQASIIPMVTQLIEHNDPDIKIPAVALVVLAKDLGVSYKPLDRVSIKQAEKNNSTGNKNRKVADQFRKVILDSRDRFTQNRSKIFWRVNLAAVSFKFRQIGGTEMGAIRGKKRPYYSWSAVDTVSLWSDCPSFLCSWKESSPISWGRAVTKHNPKYRWPANKSYWHSTQNINKKAWRTLEKADRSGRYHLGGGQNGIKDFYSWNSNTGSENCGQLTSEQLKFQTCPLRIVVTKPYKKFEAQTDNSARLPDLQAVAAGAAIFEHSTGLWNMYSGQIVTANLYHPLWVPRLTELPDSKFRDWVHLLAL